MIKLFVQSDGTYTVTNTRNGFTKTYKAGMAGREEETVIRGSHRALSEGGRRVEIRLSAQSIPKGLFGDSTDRNRNGRDSVSASVR